MATLDIDNVPVKHHTTNLHPSSWDLCETLTQPVNQGLCGGCYSISTTQCLRDRLMKATKKAIPALSFQMIIDCATNCITFEGREGCSLHCNGGFLITAYSFLQDHGTTREAFYPNRHDDESGEEHIDGVSGAAQTCPRIPVTEPIYKCHGFYNVHIFRDTFGITNARSPVQYKTPGQWIANANNIAEEIFLNGSVAVCFNLYSDFKAFWKHPDSKNIVYEIGWQLPAEARANISPIGNVEWTEHTGPHGIHFKTGHSVSIVGYGTHKKHGDFWICRNSWGGSQFPNTYKNGFFKIRRGINCSAIEADVAACYIDAASVTLVPSNSEDVEQTTVTPVTDQIPVTEQTTVTPVTETPGTEQTPVTETPGTEQTPVTKQTPATTPKTEWQSVGFYILVAATFALILFWFFTKKV